MPEFFNRDMRVSVGDLEISSKDQEGSKQPLLKMKFKAEAAGTSSPNKITLSIWNLNKNSRTKVQIKGAPILVQAGYSGFVRVMFRGDARFATTSRQGANWVTTIQGGDGQNVHKSARINENLAAGTSIGDVLKKLGDALIAEGLDAGNLLAKVSAGSIRDKLTEWTNGGVLSGKATEIMREVAGSMGYQFSIQRGAISLLEDDEVTEDQAILLSPSTGLIGSPEVGEDGKVTALSLLNGDIFPGRKLQIDSAEIDGGFFKTTKAVYIGDTWGGDWNTKIEARPIG